ncbi:Protein kinase domain [Macleaya cordata]|uniref:non-specific serine/threonine protein kinase n=1 Tax=Macleaya cordata TaxID=56857 RepID=A0A200QSA2_MACCD|nr:Protein kinase domain [Macleaya cordata]
MEKNCASLDFLFSIFILFLVLPISFSQLTPSENRILFRIQQILEFPPALQGFSNWTNFCYLPPTKSLTIVCSENHITELTVVGNKFPSSLSPKPTGKDFVVSEQTLSERFSIDSFFTTLTKLSSLKVLSLVSLGLWGPLPAKISRFKSLEMLNLSSNFIYGEIPARISSFKNLQSLVLADNLFNGSVPDLSALSVLEELDLSRNFVGPEFPSTGNKVVSVILRNNTFRSLIPPGLKNFDQLQRLDVSFNQFIGKIPPFLVSLPSIEYLNLAGNKLTGTLQTDVSCSSKLGFVDFSHNLLSGKVPLCIRSNSSNRVVLYSWNCLSDGDLKYQNPNSFCHEEALAVKPPSMVQEKGSSSKLGLILGIIGGVIGGFVVLGLLILIIFRRMEGRQAENNSYEKADIRKDSLRLAPKLLTDARHVTPAMRLGALGLPQYHVFSFEEIEEATNNFDPANLMGEGSQGQLYKGRLRDGSVVVVRCLKLMQRHSSQSLLRHMDVISKIRYRHLVSILGHCIINYQDYSNGATTIFLIFEYVSNGTLRSHLTDWRKKDMMKWSQRMSVTVGVARGIQFLHTGVTPGIFGNNLKIENIFLDENLTAKISTYFLPMPFLAGSESPFKGVESMDHIDSAGDGEKDDVYQLGVILLEVITGKQITSQSEVDVQRLELEGALTDASSQLLLREVADPSLRGTFAFASLKTTAEITINCLSKDPSQRPSIEDILWHLQYSVQVQEGWMTSGEISMTQTYTA